MRDDQRQYLLDDFEGFVSDACSSQASLKGDQATRSDPVIEHFRLAISWLRGERPGGRELRQFFEEHLRVYDREMNYAPLAYEHDALAAAIEELR